MNGRAYRRLGGVVGPEAHGGGRPRQARRRRRRGPAQGHDPGAAGEVEAGRARRARPGRRRRTAAPKPSATEPATTASRRSSRLATDATARPTSRPVRSITSGPASAGGRPVMAAIDVPDASASRQPAPRTHTPAVRLDDDVADVTGVALGAVEQPAVEHDAAADPGRHDHGDEVVDAGRRRPNPRPRASALASLSTNTGSPVALPAVAAGESRATPGC